MNEKPTAARGAMSGILPQLPPEIVIDIISRLPVKPLFRLKCVCKSWLSLISNNPHFAKLHLYYAKQDTSVNRYRFFLNTNPFQSIDQDAFCNGDSVALRELRYSSIDIQPTEFWFIGSCNGLIAQAWKVEDYLCDIDPQSHLAVWNPTTGEFRELPPPNSSMVSDVLSRDIFCGFGYDSRFDDYKIVRGVAYTSENVIKMEVFSLKANEWRSSQDLHTNFSLRSYDAATNGFLHWLVNLQKVAGSKLGIFSFDLGEEKFLEMVPVPDDITKNLTGLTIRAVGDGVIVCTDYELNAELFEGWIMKRDGREINWIKLYSFSRDTLPIVCENFMDVIWVAKNRKVVLDVDGRELIVYNPEDQSSLQYEVNSIRFNCPIAYIETLVSPNAT